MQKGRSKLFKEDESSEILKVLRLIENIYNYFKNMTEENISQEFRRKSIDETKNKEEMKK